MFVRCRFGSIVVDAATSGVGVFAVYMISEARLWWDAKVFGDVEFGVDSKGGFHVAHHWEKRVWVARFE